VTTVIKYKEKTDSIRIRHKTLRGIMMIVRDRARPLSNVGMGLRPVCKVCGSEHTHKTYHFQLDDEGCVLVSTGIYDNLCHMYDKAGFDIADVIHDPPAQLITPTTMEMDTKAFSPGQVKKEA